VLPAEHRIRDGAAFRRAVGSGRRAGTAALVVHLAQDGSRADDPPRVGLVVSRAVGGAVVRNRVKRRLRHVIARHLRDLPAGSELVIRARPAAAGRTSAELDEEISRSLSRMTQAAGKGSPS
jgi:ribonuclease P protein component